MKRNAMIRIVIWSIVILLLVGILLSVLFGLNLWRTEYRIDTTVAPLVTAPMHTNAVATKAVNIRNKPNINSEAVGMVDAGEDVYISRLESVSGSKWAYITYPSTGWVVADCLQFLQEDIPIVETTYIEVPDGKNTFPAASVSELEIEWVAGDILIQPGISDQITVKEDGVSDDRYAMVLRHQGDKLKITFCEEGLSHFIGFGSGSELEKDLTITVPKDWICESLRIECASATVEVNDMTIREVDFDGASGACEFENCTVGEIDIDTASGDIRFVGSLDILDCDAASASVYAVLSNVPSRLDMDTMSGDLDITLPEDAGFALALDSSSSDFESDFETTMKNGNYVCGDGRCRINVDALSGDVTIRKGESTVIPAAPEAPIAPDAPTAP